MVVVAWLIGWFFTLLMAFGVFKLTRRRGFSDEEYERESKRPSLLRTGLQEFQGFLEPEKKAALRVVQEEKRKTDRAIPGEPPESGE